MMLSHSPLSGPYAGNTTCSFAVSFICSVSERCGFLQSYCIPDAPHHHPLMMFSFFLSPRLVPTHRKKSVFSWEQLVVLTYVCERDGSPSFLFARNVPQSIGVFPHSALRIRVACLDVFQTPAAKFFQSPSLSNLAYLPSPVQRLCTRFQNLEMSSSGQRRSNCAPLPSRPARVVVQSVLLGAFFFITSLTFLSSDQPISYNLLWAQPPSTTSFRTTLRCFSVHSSLFFFAA